LIALYRAISVYGPQTEEGLTGLVAPQNMLGDAKPDMVKKTLNRWRYLGFFETRADGTLALATSIPPYSLMDDVDLRGAILKLILQEKNNGAILSSDSDDDEKFPDASDLTRAVAWMLAQDPFTFPDSLDEAEHLQSEQRVVPKPFINDVRWNGFKEWAVFLGLAMTPAGNLVANPVVALKPYVLEILGDRTEMLMVPFLDELRSALPVLDGGRYRLEVQSQTAKPWREHLANEISPSLSVALLSLDEGRDIRLETRSDAEQKMLTGAKGVPLRQVSHIINLRGKQ
jgi:hypothetical protein